MGKRCFGLASGEVWDGATYDLDAGAYGATNEMRVGWSDGTAAHYLDIYTAHPTGPAPGRMEAAAKVDGGTLGGKLVRITYEDSQGPDRIMAGIRAVREALEMRGRAEGWLGSPQNADDIVALLRSAEFAFGSRGRAEAHCAANS